MDPLALALVIAGALCHASWNLISKKVGGGLYLQAGQHAQAGKEQQQAEQGLQGRRREQDAAGDQRSQRGQQHGNPGLGMNAIFFHDLITDDGLVKGSQMIDKNRIQHASSRPPAVPEPPGGIPVEPRRPATVDCPDHEKTAMPQLPPLFAFDNTYARDLKGFYVRWPAEPASKPVWALVNDALAEELGVDPARLRSAEGLAALAGNAEPAGAAPLAQAYAGHQFGGFSPRLGDGRALLLGEVIDRHGRRRDIALKGSGRTPFSRNGDGKCALGPALREYLIGEAMHALGIPSTRALAVVASGDMVRRERALPGAVLTRVAASHLRVGTFEYFAAHQGPQAVEQLANYTLLRHDPALAAHPQPYLALLQAVCARQAALVARWLGVGFIHGVMNTDNMTLSGETIDYGPCAFLEAYDPETVFSSIDTHGRYAYGNQGDIAQWNLARLAETLLPLIDPDEARAVELATEVIRAFPAQLADEWLAVMRTKLGLAVAEKAAATTVDRENGQKSAALDRALAEDFLKLLHARHLDFTLAFRALYDHAAGQPAPLSRLFTSDDGEFAAWQQRWQTRQPQRDPALLEAMRRANPWLIARNHRVEEALAAASEHFDLEPCRRLLAALHDPFTENPAHTAYAEPAPAAVTANYRTFCGT